MFRGQTSGLKPRLRPSLTGTTEVVPSRTCVILSNLSAPSVLASMRAFRATLPPEIGNHSSIRGGLFQNHRPNSDPSCAPLRVSSSAGGRGPGPAQVPILLEPSPRGLEFSTSAGAYPQALPALQKNPEGTRCRPPAQIRSQIQIS